MSVHSDERHERVPSIRSSRLTTWPLTGAVAAALGAVATFSDSRAGEPSNPDYTVTVADMADVEHGIMRFGGFVGYLAVLALIVFAAVWHRRVVQQISWSIGAAVVLYGLVASSATLTLAYGWKAAIGNYAHGAMEAGTYDDSGLYAYYVLNDFGPFIAWLPALVALGGLAWMAFRERLVSRILGGFAALVSVGTLAAVGVTGVPGLPFTAGIGLAVAFAWLAVGNSTITQEVR